MYECKQNFTNVNNVFYNLDRTLLSLLKTATETQKETATEKW